MFELSKKIKEALDNMQAVQNKYSSLGAADTEPNYRVKQVIKLALDTKDLPKRMDALWWELYSSEEGTGFAAIALTHAAKKLHSTIMVKAKIKDGIYLNELIEE